MKMKAGSKKSTVFTICILISSIIVSSIVTGCTKPKESVEDAKISEAELIDTVTPIATPTATPEPFAEGLNYITANSYEHNEYVKLFESMRGSQNIYILRTYLSDINNDNTAEIYAVSRESNNRFTAFIVECYDLKTDTYSKLTAPEGLEYFLIEYEETMYILARYDDKYEGSRANSIYEPYLNEGMLKYKELEVQLESEIIRHLFRTELENQYRNNTIFTLDISIYKTEDQETVFCSFNQETKNLTDEMMLLFGSVPSYETNDINHPYIAEISMEYGSNSGTATYYFGGSEYLTVIEGDEKNNSINDGLLDFLLLLAEGVYENDN